MLLDSSESKFKGCPCLQLGYQAAADFKSLVSKWLYLSM